jgi:hypothetical protein
VVKNGMTGFGVLESEKEKMKGTASATNFRRYPADPFIIAHLFSP